MLFVLPVEFIRDIHLLVLEQFKPYQDNHFLSDTIKGPFSRKTTAYRLWIFVDIVFKELDLLQLTKYFLVEAFSMLEVLLTWAASYNRVTTAIVFYAINKQ